MSEIQKKAPIQDLTLFQKFFKDRLSSYVEPSRKGTPKGDSIGYGRAKYRASLVCLYGVDDWGPSGLRGMAKTARVSYGLFKKWNSEEEFKKTVLLHMVEFTDLFFNFIERLHKRKFKSYQAFLKKPLKQITTGADPSHIELADLQPISDYHSYSPVLRHLIREQWKYKLPQWDVHQISDSLVIFRSLIPQDTLDSAEKSPARKELEQRMNLLLVDDLMGVATKRTFSESDRKYIAYGLRVLRKTYENPEDPSK